MDIYGCMNNFNSLLKLFGFFPITFDGKRNCEIKISDILSAIISFVVLLTMIVMNIVNFGNLGSVPTIMTHIWNISWVMGLFSIVIMMIYQWSKCKSIVKFYRAIDNIDSKVNFRHLF